MTNESRYLIELAKRIAAAHVVHTEPCAILLTGSAAAGLSDDYSDLDLIIYHERLPVADQLTSARATLQATNIQVSSEHEPDSTIEEYVLRGVECQIGHLTIATWERDMGSVLEDFEPATPVEKAIMGLMDGIALHGGNLIAKWQDRAASYPEELARATVEHHLRFFPLWYVGERWRTRDATTFYYQMLVEVSLNLLGVLAGLNRRYFSTFQFKRLHRFAGMLTIAPDRFAERLDGVFALDAVAAGLAIEGLVSETLALVEARMPEVDTAPARRYLGMRHQPWQEPFAAPSADC